jgi:hypothetical protein
MVPVFKTDDRSLIIKGPETFARLTEAQQKTILGPRRFDLYYQGADLPDFVDTTRTPFGIGRVIKPLDRTTFAPNPRSRIREPIEPLKPSTPKTTSVDRSTPKTTSPAAKPIKPGSPVPSFTSAAHAAEYMERRFPGRLFDYSGMDLQLIQTNTAEMARLMDLYPKVADRLNYIGNNFDLAKLRSTGIDGKMRKSWNAMHSRMTRNPADPNYKSAIVYNSKVYDNARQFQDNKAYAKRIGWTVSDRDYSTSTHEFGHAVDYWVDSMSTSSPFHFAFADGRSEIGTIKAEIVKQLKPKYGELSAYGIKGRGETQRREQFAEGFSMLHNEPRATWPKFVQAMDVLLKRIMEKPVFAYDEVNEFRDLDEAGKTAARAEYNAFMKELGLKIKRL